MKYPSDAMVPTAAPSEVSVSAGSEAAAPVTVALSALSVREWPQPLAGAKHRVARLLLAHGPATASALAETLGLTAAALRRPLDELMADGFAQATERPPYGPGLPRGRGRPARVYALTAAGHDEFEKTYDDLALDLLRYVSESMGEPGVVEFATRRARRLERCYAAEVAAGYDLADRAQRLARLLSADGFAAAVEPVAGEAVQALDSATGEIAVSESIQICQHHCPIARVAQEFPVLCEAETAAFARMLNVHVVRLATLARGDGVCTARLPVGIVGSARSHDYQVRVDGGPRQVTGVGVDGGQPGVGVEGGRPGVRVASVNMSAGLGGSQGLSRSKERKAAV